MTSSSDAAPAPEVVRHRVAGAQASSARAARPSEAKATRGEAASVVKVVERVPPPPPPPPVDVAPLARALERGFAAIATQVDAAFAEIEKECVELALAAAERVVRRRAERAELDLEGPLREMLATRRREIAQLPATLRAHPEEAAHLAPKLAELAPPGARIELVPDPSTPRGDLALEIGPARVVRSLQHDFARMRQRVFGGERR
jgi:flagellar biosynthesis/type III secretory pathway protein FliH